MLVGGENSGSDLQTAIVTFNLGTQIYALPIAPIRQIIEMVTITPIPQANPFIAGVINFHGALAPVINLRRYLGMAETAIELHTPIILATLSTHLIGLIVDRVLDVLELPAEQILEPYETVLQDLGHVTSLQGLIFSQQGVILLLDLERLFSTDNTRILLEAANALAARVEADAAEAALQSPAAPHPAPESVLLGETAPEATTRKNGKARIHKDHGASKKNASEAAA